MTAKSLIDKKDHPVILQNIKATHSKYGKFLKQAAGLTNVPEIILHSIIYLESAGKPLVVSGVGLKRKGEKRPLCGISGIWLKKGFSTTI